MDACQLHDLLLSGVCMRREDNLAALLARIFLVLALSEVERQRREGLQDELLS
jgi:hypothetical protein